MTVSFGTRAFTAGIAETVKRIKTARLNWLYKEQFK